MKDVPKRVKSLADLVISQNSPLLCKKWKSLSESLQDSVVDFWKKEHEERLAPTLQLINNSQRMFHMGGVITLTDWFGLCVVRINYFSQTAKCKETQ